MFTCKTKMGEHVSNELLSPAKVLAIVLTSVGGAFVLMSILSVVLDHPSYVGILMYIGVITLVIGVLEFVVYGVAKRNNRQMMEDEAVYEFYETYFMIKSYKNGENLSVTKAYYGDMIKTKETKSFIFIYPNAVLAYPVAKASLKPEELATLRRIFKMKG